MNTKKSTHEEARKLEQTSTLEKTMKTFANIEVGDVIIGSNGDPVTVTEVYEEHYPKDMYLITMEDGSTVKASGNHLWYSETEEDFSNREEYMELARVFYSTYDIPEKVDGYVAFPKAVILGKFSGAGEQTLEYIERTLDTLGWAVETPNVIFDGYMEIVDEETVKRYDYNDFISFLGKQRDALDNNGYFQFGKVRTTNELVEISGEVNIPTVEEMQK